MSNGSAWRSAKKAFTRASAARHAEGAHVEDARHFLEEREDQAWVVKADGLAAGKGVLMCANRYEASDAVNAILVENEFGDAGARVVLSGC